LIGNDLRFSERGSGKTVGLPAELIDNQRKCLEKENSAKKKQLFC